MLSWGSWLIQTVLGLVDALCGLFALLCLLRLLLQDARGFFAHPMGALLLRLTDVAVLPLRRLLPTWGRMDIASLLAAWAVLALAQALWMLDSEAGLRVAAWLVLACVALLRNLTYIVVGATLGWVALSWINPQAAAMPWLAHISRPWLRPIRQRLPLFSGIDLSPLVLMLAAELLLSFLRALHLRIALA